MEEQKIGEVQFGGTNNTDTIGGYTNANVPNGNYSTNGTATTAQAGLPQEVSVWSKIKSFLLQDVNRDIVVTMTPHQAKVLKEVHDFWFQEINLGKVKDFLFQDITLGTSKK